MKPKRFVVFFCKNYYSLGGWNDIFDSFDTKEEAFYCAHVKNIDETYESDIHKSGYAHHGYCHVVDLDTGNKVEEFDV